MRNTETMRYSETLEYNDQVERLRLAIGSLLDIVAEIAEVVGGDDAWKDTVREVVEQHKADLMFCDH